MEGEIAMALHDVTFLVAVRVRQVEPDLINKIDMAHWVETLRGEDARVVDVIVWDSLADLKADDAAGLLHVDPWVLEEPGRAVSARGLVGRPVKRRG